MKPFSSNPPSNTRKPRTSKSRTSTHRQPRSSKASSKTPIISDEEAYTLAVEITHDMISHDVLFDDEGGQSKDVEMDIANDIDDDDNLFRFIEGDDKAEDLSMLKVVWEGESKNSEAYAPSHLIQKGRVSKAEKDQKILRLAKARIWSEKVRAKNARARAKCEVESVRILNERLRGVGGRNAPILAILEKEATRLQTFHVEKARLSRKADRTFVKRMIEKHEEFGVELKLRKRKGKGRRKKEENLEEDGPSSELSSISISKPLKQEDEELSPPPSLDRSVDAGLGVVAWEEPNPNPPSTTTSGASAFAKDSDSDDLNVIDEPSQVNPTNPTNKEDTNEQQLNITTCGFFKPTKSSLSPRASSAPTSSSNPPHSPFKTLTRTKSGQKRLKTAKEILGPPNFSPSRCKQSVSDLESQLNAEIESKKAARAARGKLAMMEQDAKRRKRRMKEEKERRGGEERKRESLRRLEEEVFQACVRGMKRGEREKKVEVEVEVEEDEEEEEEVVTEVTESDEDAGDSNSSPASSPTTEEKKDFQSSPPPPSDTSSSPSTSTAAAAAYRMKRSRRPNLDVVKEPSKPLLAGGRKVGGKKDKGGTAKATERLIEKLEVLTVDLNRINSKVSKSAPPSLKLVYRKKKNKSSPQPPPSLPTSPKQPHQPKNITVNNFDDLISDSTTTSNISLSDINLTNSMRARIRVKR